MIKSVDELIDALGGDTEVGKMFRLSQSAVANWRLRNEVPGAWHLRLLIRVSQLGMSIDPEVFGVSGDDADALNRLVGKKSGAQSGAPRPRPRRRQADNLAA